MTRRETPFQRPVVDDLSRTDWFSPDTSPTIPGPYECSTGGGYVFIRIWTGTTWLSSVTGAPTTVRMLWRGVVPGSVDLGRYPATKHDELRASLAPTPIFEVPALVDLVDPAKARAMKALYDETMTTP